MSRGRLWRGAVLAIALSAVVPVLGIQSSSASGAWAHAGPYAWAQFGSCSGTSTSYSVTMSYPYGYQITRRQIVGGECKTTLSDLRPATRATTFTWTPTRAEVAGPSDFGAIRVVWTATSGLPDPVSGTGPWFTDPTAPASTDVGVWGEVGQPTTARGWIPLGALVNAPAAASYIAVGGGGGAYS